MSSTEPPITRPRLQHSPSLPNIRFGPSSEGMKTNNDISTPQGPSAPSSPKMSTVTFQTQPVEKANIRPRHVKYASVDPTLRKARQSNGNHRRPDQRHSHALLTPPLTPSSSIRTNASSTAETLDSCTQAEQTVEAPEDNKKAETQDSKVFLGSEEVFDNDPSASRVILFDGVEKTMKPDTLKVVLEAAIREAVSDAVAEGGGHGVDYDILPLKSDEPSTKGMNTLELHTNGRVPVIFHDLRTAKLVNELVKKPGNAISVALQSEERQGKSLKSHMISIEELTQSFGDSPMLNSAFNLRVQRARKTGDVSATPVKGTEDIMFSVRGGINGAMILGLLKSFGPLRYFVFKHQETNEKTALSLVYKVEFLNTRDAEAAYHLFEHRGDDIFGMKLEVFGKVENLAPSTPVVYPNITSPVRREDGISGPATYIYATNGRPGYPSPPAGHGPRWEQDASVCPTPSPCYLPEGVCNYCPSKAAYTPYSSIYPQYPISSPNVPATIFHPSSMQAVATTPTPLPMGFDYHPHARPPPSFVPNYDPAIAAFSQPLFNPNRLQPPTPLNGTYYREGPPVVYQQFQFPQPGFQQTGQLGYASPNSFEASNLSGVPPIPGSETGDEDKALRLSPSPPADRRTGYHDLPPPTPSSTCHSTPSASSSPVNERNQFNLVRIEEGLDTRTTVMIKNIPNKMSDADLIEYINRVCPRSFDFIYLRMDFQNGCNVGYAFVNFISVQDLLRFAKSRLGVKWNMFSSEKVLQMSYANYQGKDALIEKFKNSSIMDERESWRPRIFHSSGPEQGLPEPFPAPTHIRRKERSLLNRGALYVPGFGAGNSGLHHPRSPLHRRHLEDNRGAPREHPFLKHGNLTDGNTFHHAGRSGPGGHNRSYKPSSR